jgi:hypothetical protein
MGMEKNNKLDRIIREKLENFRPEFDPESWELMEQRLDSEGTGTPETKDTEIDEVVFERLHQLKVDYNPASWHLMASRLNEEFGLVRRLYQYKAMEAALMLLLLLTLFQYLPPSDSSLPLTPRPSTEQPLQEKAGDTAQPELEGKPGTRVQALEEQTPPGRPSAQERFDTGISEKDRLSSAISQREIHGDEFLPGSYGQFGLIRPLPMRSMGLSPSSSANPLFSSIKEHSTIFAAVAPQHLEYLAPIDPLDPQGLIASSVQPLDAGIISPRKKGNLYFGMFGSSDYNRIITPPTIVERDTVSADRYALGYGGGFSVGYERGRWELQTGVIYTAKRYDALPILYVEGNFNDGYYGEGFKTVELNMLNIPLNLRYNFYKKNRLRLYALTGISLQVAVQSNYYIATQDAFRNNLLFAPAPAPSGGTAERPEAIEQKKIADGWFEGGTFEENSTITGNVGIGVERFMTTRWSLFAQPTYFHSLHYMRSGYGPYYDEINTFSLFMGLRIKL